MLQPAPEPDAVVTTRRPADLVDRLARIRLERDLTYAELAAAIGIGETVVYRFLMRATRRPPLERTLHKIRRYVERIEAREK